jgi:release factor glutamine methyltransferase
LEHPCDRAWLYAHATDELHELWWIHYGRYLHERMQGKPTQYITGVQEFYGRDFRVSPEVLIPRPETEDLIDAALGRLPRPLEYAHRSKRVLDIGTGSGAIAITLALDANVWIFAVDISQAALRVASDNARTLGASASFVAGDLGSSFADATFDMVVSNPPYVPLRDRPTLQREVRDFEPPLALFAGDDGLDIYRRLIPEARRLLKPGGWLIVELGHDSFDAVREMLLGWDAVEAINDLAGIPRVVTARSI